MRKYLICSAIIAATVCLMPDLPAQVSTPPVKVRIKDVARIAGDEETYTLVGYGIVTGLNNTGDSDKTLTQRTITNLMQNFNIIVSETDIKAQNTAAVMVTATIRGSKRKGDAAETLVSSIGDAKSLLGGVLVLTPLLGTDNEAWGIAQGAVTTGGYSFGTGQGAAGGNEVTKNHPTTATLTNGCKLLRDVGPNFNAHDVLKYNLKHPDYTSSVNLADAINKKFFGIAVAEDDATVKVRIPDEYKEENRVTSFISEVEQLYFTTDNMAKVVFNERTGTIVMGADVKISAVAVSHGSVFVNIKNTQGVSQPSAFSTRGDTQVINDTQTNVKEDRNRVFEMPNITTIGELVRVLNALGVSSRDIISIFHCLRESGALHAELIAQ